MRARLCFLTMLLFLSFAVAAKGAVLDVTRVDLGAGVFRYELTLNNVGLPEPLAGLNIMGAESIFGITPVTPVAAPSGWSFFPPIPGLVDELNFFSLAPASDVPIGGSLSGFTFESAANASIPFDVVGASGVQYAIPEPNLAPIVIATLAGFAVRRKLVSRS